MGRALAVARSAIFVVFLALTVMPWAMVGLVYSIFVRGERLYWYFAGWLGLSIWAARVICGVHARVHGRENLPGSAVILLSKHQSTWETFAFPTLMPRPLCYVFKRELLYVPFFGWAMARMDLIHIDRSRRAEAWTKVAEQGRRYMAQGNWVIMFPEGTRAPRGDLLFCTHDLSWSGAPLILWQMATWCVAQGYFVTVMSPEDGPLRKKFSEAGMPVVVDPLIAEGHASFVEFAGRFDCVIANTIFAAPIIQAAQSAAIPHFWWIHEGEVAEDYLNHSATIQNALTIANLIVTPNARSARVYQSFSSQPIRVLAYGIPDPQERTGPAPNRPDGRLTFLLLGSIEQRKGQEVLLDALARLPPEILAQTHFQIVGRPHDPVLARKVRAAAKELPGLSVIEAVAPEAALEMVRDCQVMLCTSWDETGPLTLIEALAFGKPILSTKVGIVAENLAEAEAGFIVEPGDAADLAEKIERYVREPELLARFGRNARAGYEKFFTFERFSREFAVLLEEAISIAPVSVAKR